MGIYFRNSKYFTVAGSMEKVRKSQSQLHNLKSPVQNQNMQPFLGACVVVGRCDSPLLTGPCPIL